METFNLIKTWLSEQPLENLGLSMVPYCGNVHYGFHICIKNKSIHRKGGFTSLHISSDIYTNMIKIHHHPISVLYQLPFSLEQKRIREDRRLQNRKTFWEYSIADPKLLGNIKYLITLYHRRVVSTLKTSNLKYIQNWLQSFGQSHSLTRN